MGSDRARITYDESRQYRAVVMQQGRVTVEADWNEEEQIIDEEIRKDALDFVGSNGTPDNGYKVIETGQEPPPLPKPPPFDFFVNKGTMYVGGVRAFLADDVQYSKQQEWLDHLGDPDWVDPSTLANGQRELIYLYLREQEVSAVEDSVLREVALGGPDTAQRLRLIQHIVRLKTGATDCPTALATAQAKWEGEGLTFNDQTMRLMSSGRLKASFQDPGTTPDPCEPVAHGGFLGAENQLIRIQISGFDQATKTYRLTWGFDDASFLYRVTVIDNRTLQLLTRPVDDAHNPRPNQQAVEVLRSAAQLSATDYVASATGFVTTLTAYAKDTQRITLPVPLPAEYLNASETPAIFLRVWEEEKTFTAGSSVPLGQTGLQVTLTAGGGPFHIGDYWLIAVRPNTPTEVYPQRYLKDPQPPDGPRLWACPLKVIEWNNDGTLKTLDDCRNLFNNLVELTKRKNGGCCNVTVRPEDLTDTTTLNTIIAHTIKDREQATVCLTPGVYSLSEPLRLGPDHSNLTLESCHDGVVIQAAAGHEDKFLDGLIVLTGTPVQLVDNVTLRGLQFNLPPTPFVQAGGTIANIEPSALRQMVGSLIQGTVVSVGVRSLDCTRLTIQDCLFTFSTNSDNNITGFGILVHGTCAGLTVQGNTFVREGPIQSPGESPSRFFVGYQLDSNTGLTSGLSDTSVTDTIPAGTAVPALLQDASFQDNLFKNINVAATINAQIVGIVKVVHNTVEDCFAGFSFDSATFNALATLIDEVLVPREQLALAQHLRASSLSMMQDPARMLASVLARGYPLPPGFEPLHTIHVEEQKSSKTFELGKSQVQMFFDKALPLFSRGPLDAAAEKVNVKEGATTPPGEVGRLNALNLLLSTFERAALLPVPKGGLIVPSFSIHVSGNDIATIGLGNNSAPAFEANHPTAEQVFDVIMSANKMQIRGGRVAAVDIRGGSCVITGNLILVSTPTADSSALLLIPNLFTSQSNAVAVTGNVFGGPIFLPGRIFPTPIFPTPPPPPLDRWEFLNTVLV